MTRFTWTDADRANLVPGSSVVVHWAIGEPSRAVVKSVEGMYAKFLGDDGAHADFANARIVEYCDPASIKPPKQLDLFSKDVK